ncbi:bisanhydrobacterioruberin hydratase [Halorientalis litorea]|uniref:bisanhydrobacterioruberin hydratase n=1 Tax=Halorientalis litorea TaxID=2931977 RepID=UPI001FF1A7F7|nr:bisanhydrobacterioruberin hydratase [Halorientalis litorea]
MAVESVSRERVEARLDRLVRENRFTIAVVFPLAGAVLLLASAETLLPGPLNFNPYLVLFGTFVMRLPLIAGVAPLVDRKALLALVALTLYSYAIEYVGVTRGWPYGFFEYGVDLGPMLLDTVPLGLPIFFFPLVLNSYLLCTLLLGERAANPLLRLPVVIAAVLAVDLVLDPGAVALGFWAYDGGGAYYAVPWSNYEGWVLSATVAVVLFDIAFDRLALTDRVRRCEFMLDDLVSFVILWGAINAYFGNWVPVAVASLFFLGLVRIDRFDFRVFDTAPLVGRVRNSER